MGFIKKTENFTCQNCGEKITGTGYTNHCPNCLWSKHVDEEVPGDRKSTCQGMMEPIGLEIKSQEYIIIHCCQNCGKTIKNKASENDNFPKILALSSLK